MIIRNISISSFRGIRELNWKVNSPLVCLVGPGDSAKSTILSAIEYALFPQWNLTVSDSDFFEQDNSKTINIEVTVGGIPKKLISENKFGLYLRGWNVEDGINDEPKEDDELVLTVRMTADKTLEPQWVIINDRQPDGIAISHLDRGLLGMSSIGDYYDRDMTWSRGSALARLTGELEESGEVMSGVRKQVREHVSSMDIETWKKICEEIQAQAEALGVKSSEELRPGFDVKGNANSIGVIGLYDGSVPTRLYGLGSKRLLTLSIQHSTTKDGVILLVDEVENGLEPHRLRYLIRQLRPKEEGSSGKSVGQAIFTSHSSISIEESKAEEIHVVRKVDGVVEVMQVDKILQPLLRKVPEAFLGRKIIVCEGKTEIGLTRALDKFWSTNGKDSFAMLGVVTALGEGSTILDVGEKISKLGYPTALLLDSDVDVPVDEVDSSKILTVQWADMTCIEQRVFLDLPLDGIQELIDEVFKFEDINVQVIIDKLNTELNISLSERVKIAELISDGIEELKLRRALGKISSQKNVAWFKRIDKGEIMGEVICKYLHLIPETDLSKKLILLKDWIYE